MARPRLIGDSERATFLAAVREGKTLKQAAHDAGGFDRTSFRDLAKADDKFAAEYAAAREEAVGRRAEMVDEAFDNWITDDNCAPAIRIVWAKRWNPAYRERQQVELTGDGGGPVKVEQRGVSVVGVLRVLAEVGALDGIPGVDAGSLRALPAAQNVLPAQPD